MASLTGKSWWPELVGVNGDAATLVTMGEKPNVKASTVKEGSFITTDFRCDRDRICVCSDNSNIIIRVPRIG